MYEKLLKIQQEIGAIKKDSENPFFKSAYFDINSLLEVVKPVLNKNGVVLLQGLDHINGKIALTTRLINTDGGKDGLSDISFTCPLPETTDAQKLGSAVTYLRRYALQSLLALQAEDDDGNHASSPKLASKATITPSKAKEKVIEYPENDLDAPPF